MAHLPHFEETSRMRCYFLHRAQSLAMHRDRSHDQLKPQPWRALRRLRAIEVTSRRGGRPSEVLGSTLTHPQPIPHP